MRITFAVLTLLVSGVLAGGTVAGQRPEPKTERERIFYNIANYMGMLRSPQEVEAVTTIEYWAEGTVDVEGQPCRLTSYNATINYRTPGMRVNVTCTRPNGQPHHEIRVVSGKAAWNEIGEPGAGLVPGKGTTTPMMHTVSERLVDLWSGPQGVVKAARAGGDRTQIRMEGKKTVLSFPIPGVEGGTADATFSEKYQAERVVARLGQDVTEWTYSGYADHNEPDIKLDVFFAGRMVKKRGTTTLMDLTVVKTDTANPYVIMPVPQSVRTTAK